MTESNVIIVERLCKRNVKKSSKEAAISTPNVSTGSVILARICAGEKIISDGEARLN